MDFLRIPNILTNVYYAIPDYQRDYEWTNVQIQTLIDDVFEIIKEKSSENHFFGAIVTIPFETDNAYTISIDIEDYDIENSSVKHIVDGQQRITSFSLFIKAFYDILDKDEDVSITYRKNALKRLEGYLFGQDYSNNDSPAPILILNDNTGRCYNHLLEISEKNFSKIYKGAKRLLNAYKVFYEEIEDRRNEYISEHIFDSRESFYKQLMNALTKRLYFVEIECDKSSDAFQVFDSLNGKGLDLTAADRIKNIFISWSKRGKGIEKWNVFVNCVGEEYLTNYFVCSFFYRDMRRISKNKLPDKFKESFKETAKDNFDKVYQDMKLGGQLYGKLRNANTGFDQIDSILKDFRSLKLDQVYVLIYAVAFRFGEECIKSKEYFEFISTLFNLIVRMQVCEKSMNKLDILFSKCIEDIKENSGTISLVTKKLYEEIIKSVGNKIFQPAFVDFAPKDNKIAEVYLRYIENYLRKNNKSFRDSLPRGLTVEHIIPRTLEDPHEWFGEEDIPDFVEADFEGQVLERIGNKALLYGDDNSSAGNNTYTCKLDVYRNGKQGQDQGTPIDTFQLIDELIKCCPDKFNYNELVDRSKMLSDYAIRIWPESK